jgi:flagellar basal-body rod modification protein FlgD
MNATPASAIGALPSKATPTSDPSGAAGPASLDCGSLLQPLIARMKNEDPTQPLNRSRWVARLASFSSVEQAIKTSGKLDGAMPSLALSQSEGGIGRTATSSDGSVAGTVAGVRVISGGVVAILSDGRQPPLDACVTEGQT